MSDKDNNERPHYCKECNEKMYSRKSRDKGICVWCDDKHTGHL